MIDNKRTKLYMSNDEVSIEWNSNIEKWNICCNSLNTSNLIDDSKHHVFDKIYVNINELPKYMRDYLTAQKQMDAESGEKKFLKKLNPFK